ncbi:MAG: YggS family pyridoxal phosphate-dependent enzyme [Propionibacteriaceae bacterium]|nr:YggS family pyridoxal phosphate-dependent enzyme [Propionibacteriaceae bacterium]
MGRVAANLAAVRDRIEAACRRSGRRSEDIRLMAVSKTHGPEVVREASAAGVRLFGENKVQEAADKAELLADVAGLQWAFIGHLQTNKAKRVAEFAGEFHALDSLKVARVLDRRLAEAGRGMDVFIQVNSSDEESKFGLAPAEVGDFAAALRSFSSLRVRGLMTLAVFSTDQDAVRGCFERMRDLQTRLRNLDTAAGTYDELSMGMSGDFELAIEYGATTVRVGEAIFGARLRPADYWS